MQWTEVKNSWKDVHTKFQTKWTQLTNEDLKAISGKREELIKRLHKLYKVDETTLGLQVDEFVKNIKPAHV